MPHVKVSFSLHSLKTTIFLSICGVFHTGEILPFGIMISLFLRAVFIMAGGHGLKLTRNFEHLISKRMN